jgi:hypothetical protein
MPFGQTIPGTNIDDHVAGGVTPMLDESRLDHSLSPMNNRSQIDTANQRDMDNSRKVSKVRHTAMHTRHIE